MTTHSLTVTSSETSEEYAMQQVITERVEKTREQLKNLKDRSISELEERRATLASKADEARNTVVEKADEARKTLVDKADEARKTGEGAVRNAQVTVLETARDVLAWAGERVELEPLTRGEQELNQRIVTLRASDASMLAVEGYDDLSVKKVIAALDAGTFDEAALQTLRAYEVAHKNRVTLLRELDARLAPPEAELSA
ncbi:MAG: hypothetical protein KDA24_20870 [Deltaproteobacteria bacterium]|nr:hypothetical protein [Deltaproteobacteria bacterium]